MTNLIDILKDVDPYNIPWYQEKARHVLNRINDGWENPIDDVSIGRIYDMTYLEAESHDARRIIAAFVAVEMLMK